MVQELVKAFLLIFIAEMGDKTQILAMAFATRFPVKKVLVGIFLGSLLNHGLAVILGRFIQSLIPINAIQIIAGFAFVGFSLWTLKSDEDEDGSDKPKSKFGPIITVALAFFIGELGDKTQLTAITLATDAVYPLAILSGTVLGMIVTGGIGIMIGKKLGDKIPELAMKIVASSIFMFFGVVKLYQSIPIKYISSLNISLFIVVIAILVYIILRPMIIRRRKGQDSLLRQRSKELYNYYHQVGEKVNKICLGTEVCGECQENNCIIGHTKILINNGMKLKQANQVDDLKLTKEDLNKKYDREQVIDSLRMTLAVIKKDKYKDENIHGIRINLEKILFGKSIKQINDWEEYLKFLREMDEVAVSKLLMSDDNQV